MPGDHHCEPQRVVLSGIHRWSWALNRSPKISTNLVHLSGEISVGSLEAHFCWSPNPIKALHCWSPFTMIIWCPLFVACVEELNPRWAQISWSFEPPMVDPRFSHRASLTVPNGATALLAQHLVVLRHSDHELSDLPRKRDARVVVLKWKQWWLGWVEMVNKG